MPFFCGTVSSNIWTIWTNQTQTATTAQVWDQWITTQTTSTASNCYIALQQQQAHQLSADERMREAQRHREFMADMERQRKHDEAVYKKAMDLFLSLLNDEQRRDVRE